jgi:hypothetical protein
MTQRIVAASMGLMGASVAQAFPAVNFAHPTVETLSEWRDPVNPYERYGEQMFSALPYQPSVDRPIMDEAMKTSVLKRLSALETRSNSLQRHIDKLALFAEDFLSRYTDYAGLDPKTQAMVYRNMVEDFRANYETYGTDRDAADLDESVSSGPEATDPTQPPENAQTVLARLMDIRKTTLQQEELLEGFKASIFAIRALPDTAVTKERIADVVDDISRVLEQSIPSQGDRYERYPETIGPAAAERDISLRR